MVDRVAPERVPPSDPRRRHSYAGAVDDHHDLIFVGSLPPTPGGGEGITTVRRDRRSGELTAPRLAAVTPAPSFLARHPARPVLYAVNELPQGRLSAWQVAPDGELTPLGSAPTGDAGPCHVAVHPSGRYAVCANYLGGSVSVLRLDDTGSPTGRTELVRHTGHGPDPDRQAGPHPHMAAVAPDGGTVSVVDLGADTVVHYRLSAAGTLAPAGTTPTRPGTGPRHVAVGAGLAYLVGELDGTITCFQVDGAGRWRERDRLPLLGDGAAGYPSEVAVSPDRRFVYAASRGPDRIAVFAEPGRRLRPVAEVPCGGHWPRHFALVDGHLYVANERSGSVLTFRVDPDTGLPTPTGNLLDLHSPSCVLRFARR
ncbi:MAG: beta-propeller fold lactonase family protein [Micromonosporaceae bacterium]|nr:beta-propeller fold lactonase family protein [Micromonosporaceae bacterium]